jgi:hypothetical protein
MNGDLFERSRFIPPLPFPPPFPSLPFPNTK